MSATIEKIAAIRTAPLPDGVVLLMDALAEDGAKIVAELPSDQARRLCLDLIAAGYGPSRVGGSA